MSVAWSQGIKRPLPGACGAQSEKYAAKTARPGPSSSAPPPGQALVVMIATETRTTLNCASGCQIVRVGLDGKWEGATRGNSYFTFVVSPGEHHLCSNWQGGKHTELAGFAAEPGKTYFFRTHVVAGTPDTWPGFTFDTVNADEGRSLWETLPVSEFHPK